MKEKLKAHSLLLLAILVATYLCNLFDLRYTLYALANVPHAFEMNPAFRLMLQAPWFLYLYKFFLLPLLLLAMYHVRETKIARFGIWLCFGIFAANTAYQVWSICIW